MICANCRKHFQKQPGKKYYFVKKTDGGHACDYCSKVCAIEHSGFKSIYELKCAYCGNEIEFPDAIIADKNDECYYCSMECAFKDFSIECE